jgi:hypothetical protein
MSYLDLRLSKILSDTRIEQASSIRKSHNRSSRGRRRARERLGRLLIAQGERLTNGKPTIA